MRELKQSTAVDVMIGPFLDETNGKDAETTLTVTQAEVRLSKNGANMAQKAEATSLTHDELGHYVCKLDTTDTNTLGQLRVMVHESGALPVWADFAIVTANYWDSKYSTDKLEVDLTQMGGTAQSATDLKDFADTGYVPGTHKVAGVVLVDTTTTNTDMVGTNSAATATALSSHDDALDSASGDITSILDDTGSTGVAIAAAAIAEIRSGLARATALTIHDNALAAAEETINTINGNVNSILTDTGSAGVVISAANKADIADRVWDETMADHVGAGTTGAKLNGATGAAGSGAITYTYTVYEDDESTPLAGVDVWVTTDSAGANVVAGTVVTDVSGEAIFYLDAATYYFWRQMPGWNFTNPDTEVVSA